MSVRLPPRWLGQADERLLEYLDTKGAASPQVIEESGILNYSRTHINERLIVLRKAGLSEMIGNGVYQITPEGRAFLAGDKDLRGREKPE